jgi:hypothetical protein
VDGLPQAILDLIAANPAGSLQFDAYSATGLLLRGVLSAAGSAEGFLDIIGGTDPTFHNGDFSSAEPPGTAWSRPTGFTATGGLGVFGSVAAGGNVTQQYLTVGSLLKCQFDLVSLTTGTGFSNRVLQTNSVSGGSRSSAGTYIDYITTDAGVYTVGITVRGVTAVSGTIDNVVVKQVLAPSAAGSLIVSTKSGATYNWAVNQWVAESYNAASYTVVIRRLR